MTFVIFVNGITRLRRPNAHDTATASSDTLALCMMSNPANPKTNRSIGAWPSMPLPMQMIPEIMTKAKYPHTSGKGWCRVIMSFSQLMPNVTVQRTRLLVAGTLDPIAGLFIHKFKI